MTLRDYRHQVLNETLSKVAGRSGVCIATISTLERGMAISDKLRHKVARGYRVTVDQLDKLIRGNLKSCKPLSRRASAAR